MCGRYRLKDPKAAFHWLEIQAFEFHPRFNIAPSQRVPVVTGADRVEEMIWGIVPAWATTSKALINARSESVREERSFKSSFRQRRCLVSADGTSGRGAGSVRISSRSMERRHFRSPASRTPATSLDAACSRPQPTLSSNPSTTGCRRSSSSSSLVSKNLSPIRIHSRRRFQQIC